MFSSQLELPATILDSLYNTKTLTISMICYSIHLFIWIDF